MNRAPLASHNWPVDADYDPQAHGVGVAHIGPGAFHRAHQAVYTDDALAAAGGDWRILGVSLRSTETADALNAQNGRYTLTIRSDTHAPPTYRTIGALAGALSPRDGSAAILEALTRPQIRLVSLTITEKAYAADRETGALNADDPQIAADLAAPETPASAIGLITRALQLRRRAGASPFTVMSCDNLPDNGRLLRAVVLGFAERLEPELAQWIADEVSFPSTMVDRITPASSSTLRAEVRAATGHDDHAPVETEAFHQWVIEDNFCNGRPAWEKAGALMVKNVAPYENMKLRMLNGAHSLIAYAGFLSGCKYVRDVMSDAQLSRLVAAHIQAAAQTLPPLEGVDFVHYGQALLQRFRNPNIAHETRQIAMDGSQKLPQRIFAPAIDILQQGGDEATFAFATAVWIRYLQGRHENGETFPINDPRAEEFTALWTQNERDLKSLIAAILCTPNLAPPALAGAARFQNAVHAHLKTIITEGMAVAVAAVTKNHVS